MGKLDASATKNAFDDFKKIFDDSQSIDDPGDSDYRTLVMNDRSKIYILENGLRICVVIRLIQS